jgi:hypothetical protein
MLQLGSPPESREWLVLADSTCLLFQSATRVQVIGNDKHLPQTGRLAASNINNQLTTKTDPVLKLSYLF